LSLENQFANSIYSGPTSGCIREPETKSYARKRTASFINDVASQAA
jgi:hypothetical protein